MTLSVSPKDAPSIAPRLFDNEHCDPCARAEKNPRTAYFGNGCRECDARSLANSPAYFDSARAQAMTATYKSALRFCFGEDWREAHSRVVAWADRIAAATLEATKTQEEKLRAHLGSFDHDASGPSSITTKAGA